MNALPRVIYMRLRSALALDRDSARLGSAPAIAQSQGQAMAIPAYFSLDNNPKSRRTRTGTTIGSTS